jgi:hypothetical protein
MRGGRKKRKERKKKRKQENCGKIKTKKKAESSGNN